MHLQFCIYKWYYAVRPPGAHLRAYRCIKARSCSHAKIYTLNLRIEKGTLNKPVGQPKQMRFTFQTYTPNRTSMNKDLSRASKFPMNWVYKIYRLKFILHQKISVIFIWILTNWTNDWLRDNCISCQSIDGICLTVCPVDCL